MSQSHTSDFSASIHWHDIRPAGHSVCCCARAQSGFDTCSSLWGVLVLCVTCWAHGPHNFVFKGLNTSSCESKQDGKIRKVIQRIEEIERKTFCVGNM